MTQAIQKQVQDALARELLGGRIADGDKVKVGMSGKKIRVTVG